MWPDVVAVAVVLQVLKYFLMGHEAFQAGVEGEIRKFHDLFGQVGPVGTVKKSNSLYGLKSTH